MSYPDWSHTAVFVAQPRSCASARDFVTQQLRDHELSHLVEDVQLVVSELATNAMVHAQTPFLVTLLAEAGAVRVEVRDGSHSHPVLVAALALDPGGRGVAIVKAVSRDWGVTARASGGKSVWAEFDSHPDAA